MLAFDPLDPYALADTISEIEPRLALEKLRSAVNHLGQLRQTINALEAREALVLDHARQLSLVAEDWMLDNQFLFQADRERRSELTHRALVAEVAVTTHLSEFQVSQRLNAGQALCSRAPKTLQAAMQGSVQWCNAVRVADAVAELPLPVSLELDENVVWAAGSKTPGQFKSYVRRARERVHPTPAEERHAEAACKRRVTMQPASDGMAHLEFYASAPVVHAVWDRITRTAMAARAGNDGRTLAQLRADTAAALLLDDGTLDQQATLFEAVGNDSKLEGDATADSRFHRTWIQFPEPLVGENLESPSFSLAKHARAIRPQIFVTVPVLTLLGVQDAPALLDGTVPIDAETARELATLAPSLTRLLTDPHTGGVLAIGSKKYRPPQDLGNYLKVRDVTCRFPGCNRRAAESDIDHNTQASLGGSTHSTNLTHLCRRHHVIKEQARFTVEQTNSGIAKWQTPLGETILTYPGEVPATIHAQLARGPSIPDTSDDPLDPLPDWPEFPPF
jgi:hypothetical protein